jgi:hypothetical protein
MTSPLGESRGGTPTGVRIPLDARPCQRHGRMEMRLSAFRILYSLALLFSVLAWFS